MHLSVALCRTRINNRAWSTKNTLASKLTSLSVRHSEPYVNVCKFPTIISVYAPAFVADPTCEEAF